MASLILVENTSQAKKLSRLSRAKKIRRVCRGIYTSDLKTPIADIIQKNWMVITSHIVPNGILSFRTAIELKPAVFKNHGIIFITSSYEKRIKLPGLLIKVLKGDSKNYIEQVLPCIARSNLARALLENLMPTKRGLYKKIKMIDGDSIQHCLAKELKLRHETGLNKIRDESKKIAKKLNYAAAYKKLSIIINALLSTHADENILTSPYAKSVVKKEPFDSARIQLFENLVIYLKQCSFRDRVYEYKKSTFKNISFFESYFSNFIEGTEFLIDEAEDIVFKREEINHRHADSHDVLAGFNLTNDFLDMNSTPNNATEFLTILQNRHAYLMKERPDKNPGTFKTKPNKVGNTFFVSPENVIGTLRRGFELMTVLSGGLEKALFMQFLISEVHPFDDGNGRLSRIMMNAELVKVNLFKIILPTVCRDNYLNALRLASRDADFRVYCKVMDQMQAYTASIDWKDYGSARTKIENDYANQSPDEGLAIFNRVLRELLLSEFAV